MVERRAGKRLQASLTARVAFGGRYRLRGVVLNISRAGAKIALEKPADVPSEFLVSVCYKSEERQYEAKVQWRKREVVGVKLRPLPATEDAGLLGLARARRSEDAIMDERRLRLFHLADDVEHQKPERAD